METRKSIVWQLFESVWNNNEIATLQSLIDESYVRHDPAYPTVPRGLDGFVTFHAQHVATFAEGHYTVEQMIAAGEIVITRWSFRAVHTGFFASFPPSGKQIITSGITVSRIVNDRITEEWLQWDAWGLVRQITS